MYTLYTDDSILAGQDPQEINEVIAQMRKVKLDITIEGTPANFLRVNIDRKLNGAIHITQLHLTDSILKDLNLLGEYVKTRDTRAIAHQTL